MPKVNTHLIHRQRASDPQANETTKSVCWISSVNNECVSGRVAETHPSNERRATRVEKNSETNGGQWYFAFPTMNVKLLSQFPIGIVSKLREERNRLESLMAMK
jgi:hypothetical protein